MTKYHPAEITDLSHVMFQDLDITKTGKPVSKVNSFVFTQIDSLQQRVKSFGSDTHRETQNNLREDTHEEGRPESGAVGQSQVPDSINSGQSAQEKCSEGNHSSFLRCCTHVNDLSLAHACSRHTWLYVEMFLSVIAMFIRILHEYECV